MALKPRLQFTKWVTWDLRNNIADGHFPGVYLLSISKKNLRDLTVNLDDVVYIGMTNAQGGLYSRWKQFDNSINGGYGHSGGNKVHRELGNYDTWEKGSHLFVAALPIKANVIRDERTPSDLENMGWVVYLEYEAMANYKRLTGEEPHFNTR